MPLGQNLLQTHRKGSGSAAGNREEGPDGQVEGAGEEHGVGLADLTGQIVQTVAPAYTKRGHGQQGQTHTGDKKADYGGPSIASCQLSHMDGENQVSGTEK